MARKKDYRGRRYGKLELFRYSRPGGKGVGSIWWAHCDCGSTCEVVARQVVARRVATCGKCGVGLGLSGSDLRAVLDIPSGHRAAYKQIIRTLINADITPKVTPAMYMRLMGNRCVGCNSSETIVELEMEPRKTDSRTHTQLVAICRECSRWRGGRNILEWLEHSIRVADSVRSRVGP